MDVSRAAGRLAIAGIIALFPLTLTRVIGWRWPLELLSHFQVQYFLAAVVCALVLAAVSQWRWAAAAALCAVMAGWALLPYEPVVVGQAAHAGDGRAAAMRPLRLLLSNVFGPNRRYDRVLAMAGAAEGDVLVFQEANRRWRDALSPLGRDYPWTATASGMVVYSRHPLADVRTLDSGDPGHPVLSMVVSVPGQPVTLLCTHPTHPVMPAELDLRNGLLDTAIREAAGRPRPLILIGDLNTSMWSPWYGRLEAATGLHSARRGFGVLASWPAALPAVLRIPIDHCLVSDGVAVRSCRLGPRVGSDHLPLIVDIEIPASN